MGDSVLLDEKLACAQEAMGEAAALALAYSQRLGSLTVEDKEVQSLVSEADRDVENLIKGSLLARFPKDGFVGEEHGNKEPEGEGAGTWVVDPIDGTQPFLLGLPTWCVSIAYVEAGRIELGLITKPGDGDVFVGRRGAGSTLNGKILEVSQAHSLADGVTGIGCSHDPEVMAGIVRGILTVGGVFRQTGSGACDLTYVATGQYIGVVNHSLRSWDCLAALRIIEEAGGRVTDFVADNGIASYGPLIASAPGVFSDLRGILSQALEGQDHLVFPHSAG